MTPGMVVFTNNAEILHQLRHQISQSSLVASESIANIAELAKRHPGMAVVIHLQDDGRFSEAIPLESLTRLPVALPETESSDSLEHRVDDLERRLISECLERNQQRRKETAAELGISRVTLYNKMKKFGLL